VFAKPEELLLIGRFCTPNLDVLNLAGRPYDYIDTPVLLPEHQELLAQNEVLAELQKDEVSLPTTEAREGYYGTRHLEYWLSGFRDARKVIAATNLSRNPRILDFGGASGRVIRHVRNRFPEGTFFLSDINPDHVRLVRHLLGGSITAFQNSSTAALPFPDGFFDCIFAFSVFTHLDTEDIGWLLELRRITREGGCIYVTIHDEATWQDLPNTYVGTISLQNPDFAAYYDAHATLRQKVVHRYKEEVDYNCNVFLPKDYLESHWFPLFKSASINPLAHEYQSAVLMNVG
jgi:SAM-dependent methyltransferase